MKLKVTLLAFVSTFAFATGDTHTPTKTPTAAKPAVHATTPDPHAAAPTETKVDCKDVHNKDNKQCQDQTKEHGHGHAKPAAPNTKG